MEVLQQCVSMRLNKIIQRKYNGKIQTIIHERELCEEEKFSSIYEKKKDRERKKIEIISCYYWQSKVKTEVWTYVYCYWEPHCWRHGMCIDTGLFFAKEFRQINHGWSRQKQSYTPAQKIMVKRRTFLPSEHRLFLFY